MYTMHVLYARLTCDDSSANVQVCHGLSERADYHPDSTQDPTHHYCCTTTKALHENAAYRAYREILAL